MAAFSLQRTVFYVFMVCFLTLLAQCRTEESGSVHLKHQLRSLNMAHLSRRQNASSLEITEAQKVIDKAIAQQNIYNNYRVANPRRNAYVFRPSSEAKSSKNRRVAEPVPPTLNATVLAAASRLAELQAAAKFANGTLHKKYPQPQYMNKHGAGSNVTKREYGDEYGTGATQGNPYWVAEVGRTGHAPMGYDNSYMVFRDVTNPLFGAKGNGLVDDTAAINAAIAYQNNCGASCMSSSVKGTLIYFPPGTYLISSPIIAYYYTQLVGDINDLPIIKTSQNFIGLGAIESDVYIPGASGAEWYIVQSNFFRQVRNFIVDISDTVTDKAAGFHWQVAQATSMTNVKIFMSTKAGTSQMGLFTENGSGGFMSDCLISGGAYGIYGGNQQYTVRNFEFANQQIAGVCLLWDWGWTWSGLTFVGSPIGFLLMPPASENSLSTPGSIYVLDSLFDGVATAIDARAVQGTIMDTSIITLDNIGVLNVNTMIAFANGYHVAIPAANTNFVVIGNVGKSGSTGLYTANVQMSPEPLLDSSALGWFRRNYFGKSRPQYQDLGGGSFISVKDHGAVGDGVTDDTAAIVATLALATKTNVIFFPAGSYIVTGTIVVPPNTRMTGQVWSQLVARGPFFADASTPRPMIQVGTPNSIGTVEISDMLFTSIGALPGLVMVEWNVQAETQGSVGMWDTHFRVGGAIGTKLQVAQCPPQMTIPTGCIAAAMMMHLTQNSNGYFENVWAWVADHDIDDPTNTQVTVAVGRGILIESAGPTWLYGTASEHAMLYQYNFAGAQNTFAGMIQTESPYFQHAVATESPGPFTPLDGNYFNNEPTFPDELHTCIGDDLSCNFSWAVMVSGVTNLTIAGAGLYSWFDAYDQSVCIDAQNCQQRLLNDQGNNIGFYLWNLVTIGSVEMISDTVNDNANTIFAANNTQIDSHPFWSALAAYAQDSKAEVIGCTDDDTRNVCNIATYCDYTLEFATLDAISAASAAGTINDACISWYSLATLSATIDGSISDYTSVDTGYDGLFKYYVEYVKNMVPYALTKFMAIATANEPNGGDGQKYFDCAFVGKTSVTQPCPLPAYLFYNPNPITVTYTLRDSDGFYAALASKYSIDSSWIVFKTTNIVTRCNGGRGNTCSRSDITYNGLPQAAPNFTPTNPKDTITKALPQIASMQDNIMAREIDIAGNTWGNDTDDVVQTIAMPVFMISQAVTAMNSVKNIAKQQKKEDQIKLIVLILGIIFSFIPFLDIAGPALGIADGVFEIAAAAGNIGLAIQGIVDNPASAPMEILGALTLGRTKTTQEYAGLAAAERVLTNEDLSAIGKGFKADKDKLTATLKRGCFSK